MKINLLEPKSTEKHLEVEMPQATVAQAFEKRLAKVQKQVQLNGFRAGKAPRQMVIQRFGDQIRSEAIQEEMDKVIRTQIEENKINAITQPYITEFNDDKENDIKFKVVLEIDPEFALADGYADLGIKAEEVKAEAAEVEKEIAELQKRVAQWVGVERAAQEGDLLVGEYLYLAIEEEARELPEKPIFRVEIGNTGTPEFDKQLTGLAKGDEKEVKFVFPASYPAEELRGKLATYKLRIDEVQEAKLDELNDEFATKLGAESLADLQSKIEERIQAGKDAAAQNEAQEKAMDILLEKNVFDVPEARIASYIMRALNKEQITAADMAEHREEAIKSVRRFRILDAIAAKENLKPSQEEVDARIQEMSNYYGIDFEKLKADLRSSGRIVALREEMRLDQTLKFIIGIR